MDSTDICFSYLRFCIFQLKWTYDMTKIQLKTDHFVSLYIVVVFQYLFQVLAWQDIYISLFQLLTHINHWITLQEQSNLLEKEMPCFLQELDVNLNRSYLN